MLTLLICYIRSMPLLLTKIEGKGNGIKTVIPNMSDVARALSRPPTYPTKFFGCELGAQTSFDEKGDRYIVNGAHDASRLRELLDGFIDKFVLCAACKNPETDLIITKNEDIIRDCKACGQRTNVDMRHKLTTFILKNPPKPSKKSKKSKGGENTTSTDAHANGNNGSSADGDAEAGGESDDELTKRIKTEAAELASESATINKEDDWLDTSPEAVKARMEALGVQMKKSSLVDAGEDASDEDADSPYTHIGEWAQTNRASVTPVDVYKKAQELKIETKHKTVQVLVQALFTEHIVEEVPKFAPLFKKVNWSLLRLR